MEIYIYLISSKYSINLKYLNIIESQNLVMTPTWEHMTCYVTNT